MAVVDVYANTRTEEYGGDGSQPFTGMNLENAVLRVRGELGLAPITSEYYRALVSQSEERAPVRRPVQAGAGAIAPFNNAFNLFDSSAWTFGGAPATGAFADLPPAMVLLGIAVFVAVIVS